MFANLTTAFAKSFNVIGTLADAADLGATAIKNLAEVAAETSGTYKDNAKIEREIKQVEKLAEFAALRAKLAAKQAMLAAPSSATDVQPK